MITLTRLSGSVFALNSDLIERVDSTPDTVITLVDGTKYVVLEDLPDVVSAIREYRGAVIAESARIADSARYADGAHPDGATEHDMVVSHGPHASCAKPRRLKAVRDTAEARDARNALRTTADPIRNEEL